MQTIPILDLVYKRQLYTEKKNIQNKCKSKLKPHNQGLHTRQVDRHNTCTQKILSISCARLREQELPIRLASLDILYRTRKKVAYSVAFSV